MTLSHHEQQVLDRIAAALCSEDPRLASTLRGDGWTSTRVWHRLSAGLAFLVGATALLLAVFVPHRTTIAGVAAVAILAYLVMFGAALALVIGMPRIPRRAHRPAGDSEAGEQDPADGTAPEAQD